MKKYISMFLFLLLVLQPLCTTVAFASGTPTIVCEDVSCQPGEQITVRVNVENNPGFAYLEITPNYSSELTLIKATNGNLISDFTKGNQYVWLSEEDVTKDGLLMTFTFQVADNAPAGEYSVGFTMRMCVNYNEEPVTLSVKNGTIRVGGQKTANHQYIIGGETKTFDSLEQALAAAIPGTIRLLSDCNAGTVVLKPGVTLDLNGHTLKAELFVGMSGAAVLDGGDNCTGGGLLKIGKDNLTLLENSGNIVPVWNGTDGYVFTKVTFQQMEQTAEKGAAQYIFLPAMSNPAAAAFLANGGADNGLKVKVCLTWNGGKSCQYYTFSDDLVKQVFDGTNQWAFCAKIAGISGIRDMKVCAVIATETGVQAANTEIPIQAS